MVRMILQGKGTKTCGQCSVAMLANTPLGDVIHQYGHSGTSNLVEAKNYLTSKGFKPHKIQRVDNRKKFTPPTKNAMVRIELQGRSVGHMVAYINGKVYDPAHGKFDSIQDLLDHWNTRWDNRKYFVRHVMEVDTPEEYLKGAGE